MRKKLMLVMGLLCFMGSTAFAIDFMGPPTAELKAGQWDVGFVYSTTERDLEISGFGLKATGEVETNRYYGNIGYGLSDYLELGIKLGVADAEAEGADIGGLDFAWGFSTKYTFASDETLDWGALFQMSWLNTDDSDTYDLTDYGYGAAESAKLELDVYEMQIAVGPTFKQEGWKLYGGPFVYLVDGDLDITALGGKAGFDVEEDSAFGGYVGACFDLAENTNLAIEFAGVSGGWGLGIGISWEF